MMFTGLNEIVENSLILKLCHLSEFKRPCQWIIAVYLRQKSLCNIPERRNREKKRRKMEISCKAMVMARKEFLNYS